MPLLEVEDLRLYYTTPRGDVHAVDGASFAMEPGEALGIVGESGSGKTSLAAALIRMLPANVARYEGSVLMDGADLMTLSNEEFRRAVRWKKLSMAFQGAMNALNPVLRVGSQIGETALLEGVPKSEVKRKVQGLLERVGLSPEVAQRYPHELSGGMKQRVVIAMALVQDPALVILDEPTSGLDPLIQHEFYEILDEVKAEGRTVFFSSHVLPEVQRVSDRVGIIRKGRLVAVEDVGTLIDRAALHRFEIEFASEVSRAEFEHLEGASDLSVDGRTITVSIAGSPDALIKASARHEIVRLVTHEASLDDIFLTFYSEDGEGGDAG